jgi:signal transduction histidine kinase
MFKRAFLFIACALSLVAKGQERYSISRFSNKDGLPANAVNALEWDPTTGVLWIGTEGGIVRWDGSNFEVSKKTEGRVMQMGVLDAEKKTLFALCDDDFIYEIANGQIRGKRRYQPSNPDPAIHVADSIALFNQMRTKAKELPLTGWISLVHSSPDTFLISTDKCLYYFEGQQVHLLQKDLGYSGFYKIKNHVLVSNNNGLWFFNQERKKLELISIPGWNMRQFRFVKNDNDHLPMAYHGTTLYRFVPDSNFHVWNIEPLFSKLPQGFHPNVVRELTELGMIVIGDGINGIYVLRKQYIHQLTDTTRKIDPALLVTYGQGLLNDGRIVGHSGIVYDRNGPIPGVTLPIHGSVHLYRFGNGLYFPNPEGIQRYNVITNKLELLESLPNDACEAIAQTRNELYFIGGARVFKLSGDRMQAVYQFPLERTNGKALRNYTAAEWAPGVLALGSDNYIRFVDIDRKQISAIKVSESAPIRHIWPRPDGAFICSYGEGIFLLQKGKVYALPADKSGYLRFAHAIVPDGHGFCYISTNNGLFKVSEKALKNAALTKAPVYYHYLGREDGLEQTELNGGGLPAYLQLPDKSISFPTMNGLAQFHPDSVHIAPPSGNISAHASADGLELKSFPAKLPAQTKNLQFDVTISFWGSSENNYGWYRLRRNGEAGDESQWIMFNPSRQRVFNFTALKPDPYDFEIRTFNGFESGNFAIKSFHFEVAPPWYATRGYTVIWALLVCALVWLTIYLRTRQLRMQSVQLEKTVVHRTQEIEQQKQQLGSQLKLVSEAHDLKERLIAVISHNIITPLRYIHRATTMMRDDARSLDPALREKAVDSINDTSLELELLSVNLLNWIKLQHKQVQVAPEAFTFSEIADHIKSLLGPVAKSKGQKIIVESSCDTPIFQYKDAIQVILYNLVLNATTHSGGTTTKFMCSHENDNYVLTVEDNGTGISKAMQMKLTGDVSPDTLKETENQGKGFGFIIIRDLIQFIGGQLTFEDQSSGTKILVKFQNQVHMESE